ncbi:NOP58 family protein [Candidatus Micrarchaeota archaeon]|nr:NOP58 family protein [Candidatus Micrarchaeota archaeon]
MERSNKRARFLRKSKESVKEAMRSRDMLLAGVTKAIETLDKTINLLEEQLEEWYSIYFPELKSTDKIKFARLVTILDLDDIDEKELSSLVGEKKASEISAVAKNSLGAKLSANDLAQCIALAKSIVSLDKQRSQYEEYQKKLAEELCPNVSEVAGPEIAAKLVAHVGSLYKLALLPASAIQVIGAEKALFKHLKNRKIPPPKHGIIFQHVRISTSPKKVRGKIARALANKITIATKADAFSKRRISAQIKKDFDERYNEIMAQYEKEKKK